MYTLPPTEHLLYLLCHALKHFMHSGFGIRQVCDIALFANRHGSQICWQKLLDTCREIHGDYFAAAVFQIGYRYFDIDPGYSSQWQAMSVDASDMLEDLLCGGIYGGASANRVHSSNITLSAVEVSKKQGRGRPSVWGSIFPPARKLEARYPFLRTRPWLLPAAWGLRLLRYGKEMNGNGTASALESVQIGTRRVELLRQYGVIK
jgi:hypothetical protein